MFRYEGLRVAKDRVAKDGETGGMTVHLRRERIRQAAVANGSVRIEDLARELRVSLMTVHRDLDSLADAGWLRKVRGGAVAVPAAFQVSSVRARMADAAGAKREIARHALRHLRSGQTVGVDNSTTALAVTEQLGPYTPLTVVTNFIPVVTLIGALPGMQVIGLGGDFRPEYDAFLGLRAAEMAASLRTDVLLMSTMAVADGVCLDRSQETVQVKRALMSAAAKRVMLVDSGKFSLRAVQELAPLTDFDVVIVDSATPPELVESLRGQGVTIEVAAPTG